MRDRIRIVVLGHIHRQIFLEKLQKSPPITVADRDVVNFFYIQIASVFSEGAQKNYLFRANNLPRSYSASLL